MSHGGRTYTSLEDALSVLSGSLRSRPRKEGVDVRLGYGRVLASDVVARHDFPMWDLSHFDGFAVISSDTARAAPGSPVTLRVRGRAARPGAAPTSRLSYGTAAGVLTGGRLPAGADAVLAMEDAVLAGDEIRLERPVGKGEHVYPAGTDVRRGEAVLRAGKTLMGQDLVLLASLRLPKVSVYRQPRVAILPTGDELTPDIGDRRKGKVVESHGLLMERLVEGAGGVAVPFPIVRDDRGALTGALRRALARCDVVLTLAGSSVGEPDLVESTLRGFGKSTTALVHGVRVNRGRVMGFAVVGGKPVVILPGPVQGALNAFIVFAYPLIRHHLGMGLERPPSVAAVMADDWDATGRFKDFDQVVYLRLSKDPSREGGLVAAASAAETEKVSFLVSKNAYALVPGADPHLAKGERVQAHLLPGFSRLE